MTILGRHRQKEAILANLVNDDVVRLATAPRRPSGRSQILVDEPHLLGDDFAVLGRSAEEAAMRHGFEDVQFGLAARASQRTMHAHRVGKKKIPRPRSKNRRRKSLGEIAVDGRKIGIAQIVAARI